MTSYLAKILVSSCLKGLHPASHHRIGTNRAHFHFTVGKCRAKCLDGDSFYTTRLAVPTDYENVVDFMGDAYYKHDPAFVSIGLGNTEPTPSLLKLLYDDVKVGLTIIAETRSDQCLVGAAVNVKSCRWGPDRTIEFIQCCGENRTVQNIIEFYADVTKEPNLWDQYCVLTIFDCSYLAVSKEFQGLGIGRKLLQESWHLARDCGYRLFRVDCTNSFTAKIAEGFGWNRVFTLPFCRHVKNGELIFKNIKEPHTTVQVYVDCVRYCKSYCQPYKKCKVTKAPEIPSRKK